MTLTPLRIALSIVLASTAATTLNACSSGTKGVVAGAGVAAGAYEYQNKRAIDRLNKELSDGEISQDEYNKQRKEIEQRSIVY